MLEMQTSEMFAGLVCVVSVWVIVVVRIRVVVKVVADLEVVVNVEVEEPRVDPRPT
jgi:hypothetical protein